VVVPELTVSAPSAPVPPPIPVALFKSAALTAPPGFQGYGIYFKRYLNDIHKKQKDFAR
jgi:hypothetical protein